MPSPSHSLPSITQHNPCVRVHAPQRANVLPKGDLPNRVERVAEEEGGEVHNGPLGPVRVRTLAAGRFGCGGKEMGTMRSCLHFFF